MNTLEMVQQIKKRTNERRTLTKDFLSVILHDLSKDLIDEKFITEALEISYLRLNPEDNSNVRKRIDYLSSVKFTMHTLNQMINELCVKEIMVLERSIEKPKVEIDFLDHIDPDAMLSKKEASKMCGRSESWLQKGEHLTKFKNVPGGALNVLSFAKYLKSCLPQEYVKFKKLYGEYAGLKIG